MAHENQLSRYGAISKVLPFLGPQGKAFFVAGTANDYYGDFQHLFPADADGVERVHSTITSALSAAVAGRGDVILVAPGSYDEAVTISKADITIVGLGGRGAASAAPSTTNATAITVTADDVTLINMGAEGDGTGNGLHLSGDVDRFRAKECKIEGGANAALLESTASGAVSDARFEDCEFAWSTDGVEFKVSGGGDPVTQVLIKNCLFHNLTNGVLNATVHSADIWVIGCIFANNEDATEMTKYIDLNVASTTGYIANNVFATTVFSTAKFAIATGVIFTGNMSERENPSTAVGGTNGRPD